MKTVLISFQDSDANISTFFSDPQYATTKYEEHFCLEFQKAIDTVSDGRQF